MIELGDQKDSGDELADSHPRSFGWLSGVAVLAIVLGLVVGVDQGRTAVASKDSPTAAMMVAAPLRGSPTQGLTSPRPVTPNRL
jgi:hypothetical protein